MGLSWLRKYNLVLVLVLVMGTSSAIKLTGGNVCPRVENYTVTFKESYEEPVIVNTFSWCLQIPPRCPRSRLEIRERWRIKTETRQRKLMDCCEGYVVKPTKDQETSVDDAATGKCEPYCQICEYGRCVAPNTCICEPGHRGEDCANECPAGTWGERCSQECNCETSEICNPVDGKCHCPPGWRGSGCKEECPAGMWGIDCTSSCDCNDKKIDSQKSSKNSTSTCHHETGICINFEQTVLPLTLAISDWSEGKKTSEPINLDLAITSTSVPLEKIMFPDTTERSTSIGDYNNSDADYYELDDDDVLRHDQVIDISEKLPTKSLNIIDDYINEKNEKEDDQSGTSFSSTSQSILSEISKDLIEPEIISTERNSIATSTVTINYGNYNGNQRVEEIDTKESRVKKPSTSHPIVAVVHVSGNGSPGHDGPMIMTSMNREKVATNIVPIPLDVVALIVVGSIISLGLTTLAVLAVLHIRSRLFETIRLSIYDAEKREATHGTLNRSVGEKANSTRVSSMGCNSSILACEYETPRCIVPEHQTLPRPRPASSLDLIKKQEANYSNDYPNIRLFNNLQELLEAHYDRPPSTFRQAVFDVEGEHVYDEIPLQSSTTFTTKRDS